MIMPVPVAPKIYHIVHVDRLSPMIEANNLWCDAKIVQDSTPGTSIGMNEIKQRRLKELTLTSHPNLHVGDCVPFYFCPRSIMLYLISQANHPGLSYRGGQKPIVHLEADLGQSVTWAEKNRKRWAFTLSNAGSYYFEDRCDLAQLGEIDWSAVQATSWQHCKDGKQAEFLVEYSFPWNLVSRIGVLEQPTYGQVLTALQAATHKPRVEIVPDWYY